MPHNENQETEIGDLDYSHRVHTRDPRIRGMQTAGIFQGIGEAAGDTVDGAVDLADGALGGTADIVTGTTDFVGDVAYGTGEAAVDATDAVVGGTADAVGGAWDWGVGGTADATDESLDWAVGGTADVVTGGPGRGPSGGSGGPQGSPPGGTGGFPTDTLLIGGAIAAAGVGVLYLSSQ